mgnify:CR=1 FL=1
MGGYLIRRIFLIFPTLFGIMVINFAVIQIVPGGPVEQMIAQMTGTAVESTARFSGGGEGELSTSLDASNLDDSNSKYRGAQGLDPDIIKEIEVMYGMDKPAHERFFKMLKSYIFFDFGESFFRDQKVISLVLDKMPVSISLGLWTTLLVYLISIPLGIRKAISDGSKFDIISGIDSFLSGNKLSSILSIFVKRSVSGFLSHFKFEQLSITFSLLNLCPSAKNKGKIFFKVSSSRDEK